MIIEALVVLVLVAVSYGLGWVLRGLLCLRRGGCEDTANERIAALEAELEMERMVRR